MVSEHDYREAPEAALESPDPREGLPQDPTSELHWYASRPWLENRPPLWVRVFSEKQTRVVLREEKHGCHLGFIPDAGSAGPLLSATYLPVVSVSGVFVPIAAEPGWLATVALAASRAVHPRPEHDPPSGRFRHRGATGGRPAELRALGRGWSLRRAAALPVGATWWRA